MCFYYMNKSKMTNYFSKNNNNNFIINVVRIESNNKRELYVLENLLNIFVYFTQKISSSSRKRERKKISIKYLIFCFFCLFHSDFKIKNCNFLFLIVLLTRGKEREWERQRKIPIPSWFEKIKKTLKKNNNNNS